MHSPPWGSSQVKSCGDFECLFEESGWPGRPLPCHSLSCYSHCERTQGDGEPGAGRCRLGEHDTVAFSFELCVLSLARPVLVPEIKEVVSHKYKTPMVSTLLSHGGPKCTGLLGHLRTGRVDPHGGLVHILVEIHLSSREVYTC